MARLLTCLGCIALVGAALILPPIASARAPGLPPAGKVLLGVGGTKSTPVEFRQLTRQRHGIHLISLGWGQTISWGGGIDRFLGEASAGDYRLMLQLTTNTKHSRGEAIAPRGIARGRGDAYLVALARHLNASRQYVYVRPMAEMNGHWNAWCAFNADGTPRNRSHSARQYRRAFRRIAIIMRGGGTAVVNARLASAGLTALRVADDGYAGSGRVALVWNPQGEGSPNVRGNQPPDYYPGRRYVDYVANDLYSINGRANWRANDALYARYSTKPFMVAEWAPWGHDEPEFISRMFSWVIDHPRTKALVYFNGSSSTTFSLATKRRSLRKYREIAARRRFRCRGCGTTTNP